MAARGGNDADVAAGPGRPWAGVDAPRLGRRAKRGERDAFAEIFRRHHQELYRYCLAIVRDRDDAEDALQATMAAALRSLPGEERELAVRPWLFRVAHNESVSILRGRRERDPDVAAIADPSPSQEAEVATRERLRGLVADLGELPDRQRSALVMRELSGLSHAEIGAALSCGEAAARQAVYEARTALREREEGREMECERVRAAISDRDGRRLRSRRMRAHLRDCDGCRGFAASIGRRRSDLQMLCPPLPAAAAGTVLSGLLGGGAAGIGGAGAAGAAAGAGGGLAASAAVKGGTIVAAMAIAAGAAEVGGVMPDLPGSLGGDAGRADTRSAEDGSDSAVGDPAAAEQPLSAGAASGGRELGGDAGGESAPGDEGRERGDDSEARGGAPGAGGGGRDGPANPGGSTGGAGGGSPPSSAGGGGRAAAPGQTGTSPGGGTATAPGQTGTAPGGGRATAPGQTGLAPGGSAANPDHAGAGGNSGSAPGRTGETPAPNGGSSRGGNSSK
jgi:RNA polymerase sigma factor (sigma-70 family)